MDHTVATFYQRVDARSPLAEHGDRTHIRAMTIQRRITDKIQAALAPVHLEVVNESGKHNVPPGSETHFNLLVVSAAFDGLSPVARHQAVNGVLAAELAGPVHALSLRTLTPADWTGTAGVQPTPDCLGGGTAKA